MYSGEKLGEAIRVAIRMKGVTQKEVADFFNIKQQSISAWLKNGRVGKEHLEKMIEYFSDVVPPSHFGIDSLVLNQNINANHNAGLNQSNTINNFLPSVPSSGSLKKIVMPDNAMLPTFPQGSELTIDTSQTAIIDGKIYEIQSGERFFIRKIFSQISGSLKIVCDNPEFESAIVSSDSVQIVGRVIRWSVDD